MGVFNLVLIDKNTHKKFLIQSLVNSQLSSDLRFLNGNCVQGSFGFKNGKICLVIFSKVLAVIISFKYHIFPNFRMDTQFPY